MRLRVSLRWESRSRTNPSRSLDFYVVLNNKRQIGDDSLPFSRDFFRPIKRQNAAFDSHLGRVHISDRIPLRLVDRYSLHTYSPANHYMVLRGGEKCAVEIRGGLLCARTAFSGPYRASGQPTLGDQPSWPPRLDLTAKPDIPGNLVARHSTLRRDASDSQRAVRDQAVRRQAALSATSRSPSRMATGSA